MKTQHDSAKVWLARPVAVYLIADILLITAYFIGYGFQYLALPGFVIFAFLYYRNQSQENPSIDWRIPLAMNAITILIVFFSPLTEIKASIRFQIHKTEYERIAKHIDENIKNKTIIFDDGLLWNTYLLPPEYQSSLIRSTHIYRQENGNGYIIEFPAYDSIATSVGILYFKPDCEEKNSTCWDGTYGFDIVHLIFIQPNWYIFKAMTLT